ncbi:MAG TPA: BREX-1 system adenine-specific DNA-methyltransferase PglX [Tepidisphaeraceae bacterium]|jgi:hypothetical protein|nr:BREX-1 system adenine-specific DNA-methyltransferase PglX [Tepidisphaeraceae bacterium]
MAFDQPTRNRLARFVGDARRILTEEFTRQCKQDYGIDPDSGEISDIARLTHLNDTQRATARILRETLDHYLAGNPTGGKSAAIERIIREQAFTVLNRLCALRMAEARDILIESVGKGYQSKGFQLYARVAGTALGETGDVYRCFLSSIFDEIATDLPSLFDRFSAQGRLFPSEGALLNALAEVNHPDIDPLWAEDETIGWLYQYFSSIEERRQMRDESAAPRNSRELAVRNQFFTPRYVVEFLVDNTLGRLWYEMNQGQTRLKESCRYLVRRPTEIFLAPGKQMPNQDETATNLSQEALLKQPVHIPHRPLKDPREIRLIDPACGSMHFGLYAFDLFTVIYDEAWEIVYGTNETVKSTETFARFVTFAATFSDKSAFLREVPRLIVEHNIHGIDIDPRATQIAGLSLWLRAQRAWHQAAVKPVDRPRITRSNIVCAEPMPGETQMVGEFIQRQFPPGERAVFGYLLDKVFNCMKLAGEAGSLLRVEEEIRSAVAEAKSLWQQVPRHEQALLFTAPGETSTPRQMRLDLSGITDDQFWVRAEQRIYDALQAYAEQAESSGGFQRRLFAADAAQGFAFIDLCRKRYDVAVMNPPFGLFTESALTYAKTHYPSASNDFYAAFVLRTVELTGELGMIGVISSRLGFFLEGLQSWRETLMCEEAVLRLVADLGYGVLDALVETAAYVIDKGLDDDSFTAVSALSNADKDAVIKASLDEIKLAASSNNVHLSHHKALRALPGAVIAYWLPQKFVSRMLEFEKVSDTDVSVFSGLQTDDDFRFLRLAWESPIGGTYEDWFPFAKGGEYQPFADDLHLVVKWTSDGEEMKQFVASIYENWSRHIKNTERYFRGGLTYTERTTSDISVRAFPAKAIFSVSGPVVQSKDHASLCCAWALFTSRVGRALIEMAVGSGDTSKSGTAARHYRTGILKECFWPQLSDEQQVVARQSLETLSKQNSDKLRNSETHRLFALQNVYTAPSFTVSRRMRFIEDVNRFVTSVSASWKIDQLVSGAFGLDAFEVDQLGGPHPFSFSGVVDSGFETEVDRLLKLNEEELCAESLRKGVHSRTATKKSYIYSRQFELIAAITRISPLDLGKLFERNERIIGATDPGVSDVLSVAIGCIVGRWDIRYATRERPMPELPDPFAALPVCPPGMLQGDDGLPLSPEAGRRLRAEGRYPLDVSWDGILVDDPEHALDVERRVRAALVVIWGDRADALEQEACTLLGERTLREWFRKPAGFFADHLKRYSKSRRQAPIYWPLSTPSGSYTLWIYYHRLTDQTLFTAVNDFVEPKLLDISKETSRLRGTANRSAEEETALEEAAEVEIELREFHDELLRIARFWKPNLNDGVQITAAPLWRLFQLRPWQRRLKETWEALESGKFDWAHLAYSIWPDRVREKCKTDKSLAIAHGLEDLYKEPPATQKRKRRRKAEPEDAELIEEME